METEQTATAHSVRAELSERASDVPKAEDKTGEAAAPASDTGATADSDAAKKAAPAKDEGKDDRPALEREPYGWDRCTITVVLQFMPLTDGQEKEDRLAIVSARDHLNTPIVQAAQASQMGTLPPVVLEVMERLKEDLPNRESVYLADQEKKRAEEEERKARQTARRTPMKTRKKSWDALPGGAKSKNEPAAAKNFTSAPVDAELPTPNEESEPQLPLF